MFRRLSEDITFLLIKNKILDIESREIYLYAVEVIVLNASILAANFFISIFTDELVHFWGLILFFIPLRVFVGGYHCNRSESCLILSVGVYILTILLVKYEKNICVNSISFIATFIAGIVIMIYAPFINKNHPLEEYQIQRNRKIVYGLIAIDFALGAVFWKYNFPILSSEVVFIVLVAITLIAGRVKEKFNAVRGGI